MKRRPAFRPLRAEALEPRLNQATLTVTSLTDVVNPADDAAVFTLREAVNAANSGLGADTITFSSTLNGTVTLGGTELALTDTTGATTILGTGATRIAVSGNNASRVFRIAAGVTANLNGLTIRNGASSEGGGIRNAGTLAIADSEVRDNTVTGDGGGIWSSGTLAVANSAFLSNSAAFSAGAIGVYLTGSADLRNTTLSGNTAEYFGGGMDVNGGTVVIYNSTIVLNRAQSTNGGTGNGGGISNFGTVTLRNSIVAGNTRLTSAANDDLANTAVHTSSAYNLIGDASSRGGLTHGVNGNVIGNAGSGTLALSTVLDPALLFNNGLTRSHMLVNGGPAVNTGSNALVPSGMVTDQRGFGVERFVGTVDRGSVEYQDEANDPNDQISEAPLVALNTTQSASIAFLRDVDLYAFDVAAGQTILFDVDFQQLPGWMNDSVLRLFDSAGTEVALNDDGVGPAPEPGANSYESFLRHTFVTGGRYYVGVSAYRTGGTTYNAVTGGGDTNSSNLGIYTLHLGPAPTVQSITRASANPNAGPTVDYLVTFSEPVTGVGAGDFTLTTSGLTGASVGSVTTIDNRQWAVSVSVGTGQGTLALNVVDDDSVKDLVGNALGDTGAGNGNFTGETYTIGLPQFLPDAFEPNQTSDEATNLGPATDRVLTNLSLANDQFGLPDYDWYRVTAATNEYLTVSLYSDPSPAELHVYALSGGFLTSLGSSTTVDTFQRVTIQMTAGTVYYLQARMYQSGPGTYVPTHYDLTLDVSPTPVDNVAPTVQSITRASPNPTAATTVEYTVQFSEIVGGVDASDFSLTLGGGVSGASVLSATSTDFLAWTVTVSTGTGDGTLALNFVDDDSVFDLASNSLGGDGVGNGNFSGPAYTLDRRISTSISQDTFKVRRVDASTVILSGVVSSTNGTPTGNVQWYVDGVLHSTTTLTGAAFTQQVTGLAPGHHQFQARYSGSATFAPSNSPTVTAYVGSQLTVDTLVDEFDDNHTAGDLSLREAIALAGSFPGPNTITFSGTAAAGVLTLTQGRLTVASDVTIAGPGADVLTISGNDTWQIFYIDGETNGRATVQIQDLTMTGGRADGLLVHFRDGYNTGSSGGALVNNRSAVTLLRVAVTNSTTIDGDGGGIINWHGGSNMVLVDSTVSGNTATRTSIDASGGGIYQWSGALNVVNSTISGNAADTFGGGIAVDAAALVVTNAVVTGNRGTQGGGGIRSLGAVTLSNTLVAGNFRGAGTTAADLFAPNLTAANSLIGDPATASGVTHGVNGNLVGKDHDNNPATPRILWPIAEILNTTLADNGGPTKTHDLVAGGPAINAGSNALAVGSTDQRGRARIVGAAVDIGPVEHNPNSPPTGITLPPAPAARENSPGAVIGTLVVVDPDSGETFTFLVSDNRFEVVNGELRVRTNANLQYGAGPITFTIVATDSAGQSTSAVPVTINIRLGSAATPYHNGFERANVNRVDAVDPGDILWTTYYYNLYPTGILPPPPDNDTYPLVDITGDGTIDPQDILYAIVDYLAQQGGEGEAGTSAAAEAAPADATLHDAALVWLLAADAEAKRKERAANES